MRAIILAAGRGYRMGELTSKHPKCLLMLKGRTLLDLQVQALKEAGINDLAIVVGYKRELIPRRGFTLYFNQRWGETNMVSSLACAEEWLLADTCIVSYSDIFYDTCAIRSLVNRDANLALTYDKNWLSHWMARFGDPLRDAETFRVSSNGLLTEIGKSPLTVEEIQGQFMGLLRFTPFAWREVIRIRESMSASERDRQQMTWLLQAILQSGRCPVEAIPYLHEWGEIDNPSDLALFSNSDKLDT